MSTKALRYSALNKVSSEWQNWFEFLSLGNEREKKEKKNDIYFWTVDAEIEKVCQLSG